MTTTQQQWLPSVAVLLRMTYRPAKVESVWKQ